MNAKNLKQAKRKVDEVNVCPSCGSGNIVTQIKSSECYCGDCGLVLEANCSQNFY